MTKIKASIIILSLIMIGCKDKEEKHEEDMRFCKEFNDLKCEMLIDMTKKIEEYLL